MTEPLTPEQIEALRSVPSWDSDEMCRFPTLETYESERRGYVLNYLEDDHGLVETFEDGNPGLPMRIHRTPFGDLLLATLDAAQQARDAQINEAAEKLGPFSVTPPVVHSPVWIVHNGAFRGQGDTFLDALAAANQFGEKA